MSTGFVWHASYGWHNTGRSAAFLPAGGFIQPDRHAENEETKKRMVELLEVSGLMARLQRIDPQPATRTDLLRFHTEDYVDSIERMSEAGGGDAGELTPFGPGGFAIACLSAGGAIALARSVWQGEVDNGYALCRPPGHHAERDRGRGFCLLGNIPIAIKHLQAEFAPPRVAVVDWDVHHGNGTQQAFYSDPSVLTLSLHQDGYYPPQSGPASENGEGAGAGCNLNIPLPPGSGLGAYLAAFEHVVIPALRRYRPNLMVVASGFDANALDPLGRMLLTSDGYRRMTRLLMNCADEICGGRLMMCHEGGYSTAYVPFCGLAVMETLSGVRTEVVDPFLPVFADIPGQTLQSHQAEVIEQAARLVHNIPPLA